MRFGVVDGPAAFSAPYLRSYDPYLREDQCASFDLAESNVDGTIIPATGKTLTVSTSDSSIDFYYDASCTVSLGNTTNVSFNSGDLIKRVFYYVPSVPGDGIANLTITDGTSNWTFDFYVKADSY
jgi:hypothetical protein